MSAAAAATGGADSAANTSTQTTSPAAQPAPQTDAAKPANAAPAGISHRDAFDRLARGEQPAAVNRELIKESKAAAAKPAPGSTSTTAKPAAAKPAAGDSSSSTDEEAAGEGAGTGAGASDAGPLGYVSGTSEKDAAVLKRGQIDPTTWAAIPPSNRVKILNNLRESQAAADRAFQQRNRQQQGKGPAAGTQSNPDAEDEVTSGGLEDPNNQPAAEQLDGQQPNQQQQARQPKPGAQTAEQLDQAIAGFIDPADLATLEQIGGPDLANTLKRSTANVVSHFSQQTGQLLDAVEFLLEQHVGGQFDSTLSKLIKQPGLENLQADDATGKTNRDALRKKADLLHRAAGGNAAGYSYAEAMQDAAASLFKVNLTQAAQAALVTRARDARRGSADRGNQSKKDAVNLSPKDRAHAIFTELQRGASPEDARKSVDGR